MMSQNSLPERPDMQPLDQENHTALGISLGLCLGAGLGVVLGVALDSLAFIGIGAGMGMLLGVTIDHLLGQRTQKGTGRG